MPEDLKSGQKAGRKLSQIRRGSDQECDAGEEDRISEEDQETVKRIPRARSTRHAKMDNIMEISHAACVFYK